MKISVYEIGLRSAKLRDTWRADGEAATRQIVMLVLIALVGVAIAEPILLAGAPEIAGRALGAVIVFLFAAGIVISAAASTRDQQRLRALGSEAGTGSLSARLALAAVLIMALLTSALALPGVQTPRGSGEIQQRRADQSVSGEGGEENSNTEESIERVEDPNADEPLFDPPPAQSRPAPSWVQSLTGLGQWLRWPVLGAVVLLTLFGLWRLGPGLLKGLKGSFAGLFSSLRKRLRKSPRKQRSDPFARLPHLSQMEPREAVLEAYGIWLGACAHLGHAREEKQTPIEFLTAVPRHLAPLRPIGEKLTRFYTAAAYAGREINDATAAASRQAAEELQLAFSQLETAASSTASRKPS